MDDSPDHIVGQITLSYDLLPTKMRLFVSMPIFICTPRITCVCCRKTQATRDFRVRGSFARAAPLAAPLRPASATWAAAHRAVVRQTIRRAANQRLGATAPSACRRSPYAAWERAGLRPCRHANRTPFWRGTPAARSGESPRHPACGAASAVTPPVGRAGTCCCPVVASCHPSCGAGPNACHATQPTCRPRW